MAPIQHDELMALIHLWASSLGYYDGKIDLGRSDLSAFATADCTLTVHAPLWRTQQDETVQAAEVRKRLARMLKWMRVARHDMHIARHPGGEAVCLFFVAKIRFFLLPIPLMIVPLAFVVSATATGEGLRIKHIQEWPARTPDEARKVLVESCGWPPETVFEPLVAFGALS